MTVETDPQWKDVKADARSRAWRTLLQAFGIDLAAALLLAIGPALAGADFAWTREYWLALGGLVVKTVAQTGLSYVHRLVFPPPR